MKEKKRISETIKTIESNRTEVRGAVGKALALRRKIKVKETKTVKQLLDELPLSSAPIFVEVNGEILHPQRAKDRKLKKGDKVTLLPQMTGG